MNKTAYIRVSTQAQNYDRQMLELNEYFKRMGIDPSTVKIVSEKITSHTKFTERAIYPVLRDAQEGDIVYACQLDRLGRSMIDILELVSYACDKGVTLIITSNNFTLENRTAMGKLMLGMLSAMAETERELRAERCQSGTDAAIKELKENGYRISRISGKVQTRWGNDKGVDMSKANEAARIAKTAQKIAWRENSPAFKWVIEKVRMGVSRKEIIEEFNRLHELQPEVFSTPKGAKLSKGVLSYWIKDADI